MNECQLMKDTSDELSNQPLTCGSSPRPKRKKNLAARSRWWLVYFGLVAGCLASITNTRGDVITVSAGQDAFATANVNYNELGNDVGYRNLGSIAEFRAAIRFPLPATLEPTLIQSATLKLYYFDAWGSFDSRSVRAYRVLQSWSETGGFFDVPRDGSFTEATVGGTNFRWITWDVTAAARFWAADPATDFGIMLVADPAGSSDNAFRFYSREFTNASYQPVLEIVYRTPTDLNGSVTVQIAPPESVAAGARWRVNGGGWLESGQTAATVPAGSRLVEFKPVSGWKVPAPLEVRVIGTHVTTNTGSYVAVANINLGEIPSQRVYHGTLAEFRVRSDELGTEATLAMTVDSPPSGELSFDAASGVFRYMPEVGDRLPFNITFTATIGASMVSQVVSFQPLPWLPTERAVFGVAPIHSLPNDESKDYNLVNTILGAAPESFNHQVRTNRAVTISGKTVVFQQGHANGLYESYNGSDDLKEMNIHTETLIVRSTLSLPQTAVTIYARELRFEGVDAKIDTTPRSLTTRPAQFALGAHGLKAGDITIHAEHFTSTPEGLIRLVLNGGTGQSGGEGRQGLSGVDKTIYGSSLGNPWPNNTTAVRHSYVDNDGDVQTYYAPPDLGFFFSEGWQPGNGGNSQPGGKPGNGGPGGSTYGTLCLVDYISNPGGIAGLGDYKPGGRGGTPQPAYRADVFYPRPTLSNPSPAPQWQIWPLGISSFTSTNGANANSPPPDIAIGAVGSFVSVGHSLSWVSPYSLRMVLAHAKDAYLYGHFAAADIVFAEYEALLLNYASLAEWRELDEAWQFQFSEMLLEIRALRHRIGSHLDYFGNPAGWVPMLSFEANKAAYETEIDRAIRVLYLSYWIGNAASAVQARVNALGTAKDNTVSEVEDLKALYSNATALIPVLQAESSDIAEEQQQRLVDLKWLEQSLLARANANVEDRSKVPEWKKSLSVGAVICKVIPVYQPVLATVGTGLDAIAKHDPEHPFATALALGSLVGGLNDGAFGKSAKNWATNVNIIDLKVVRTNGLDKFKAYVQNMGKLAEPIGAEMDNIQKILRETEMPKTELEAELAKLKAESPEFQEIARKLKQLTERKEEFAQKLNQGVQAVTKLAADITHDLLSLDAMNRGVADGNQVLDQRAVAFLKEMDRRARERLLKYHYYMAKAYEYRLLKPYPGELNLTRLFDRMAAIAGAGSGQNLTAQDYDSLKAIYEEQLSSIVSGIFDDYNNNRPELSAPIRFNLAAADVARLNSGQPVNINLHKMRIFPLSEENIRIVNWRVSDIQTHLSGGGLNLFAFMDLYMEHSGISTLASKGQFYLFRHYNQNTEQPITWGARYDAFDQHVDPIEPSAASESLLRSLLGLASIAQTSDNLLLYSRPSAYADIVITKDVHTDNGADIVIDSLRLELQYDFVRKRTDQAGLEVTESESGVIPYFTVSGADLNSRQDALGGFERTYSKNASVTLAAPQNYGEWRFQKWTDRFGNDLPGGPATNAALTVLLTDNNALQAQYTYTHTNDSDVDTMKDEWERIYFGSIANADGTTDHDGDGVPDIQEYWNGTNPLVADTDGDGLTDWQEFIAGTSGKDVSSRFLVNSLPNSESGGNFILSWQTVENRFYRVYAQPSMLGVWTNVYGTWGDGTRKSYTNQVQGSKEGFFRIGVDLPVGP